MGFAKSVLALFACCLSLLDAPAFAQVPTYKLFNDADVTLNFQTLDPGRGTWKDQVLRSREEKIFSMTSGDPTGKIRIATPSRGYNEYRIGAGGIYRLTWSGKKQMWDVKTLQSGYGANANPAQPVAQNNPVGPGSGAAMQAAALPYRLGDSVLVLWQQKWYAATVMQLGGSKVKIHYDGYGSNWDEWVDGSRIRYR